MAGLFANNPIFKKLGALGSLMVAMLTVGTLVVTGPSSLQNTTFTNATGTSLSVVTASTTNLTWVNATGTNTTSTNLFAQNLTVSKTGSATTTLECGSSSSPCCIKAHDFQGSGVTWVTASSGVLYASTSTCQ